MTDKQAEWDAWGGWEVERFNSMAANLRPGDVLFDVGAEFGSISAIYAQMVGGENMVLFEPSPVFWPNIRLTWEANELPCPRACYVGLLGTEHVAVPPDLDFDALMVNGWPRCAWSTEVAETAMYRYLHSHTTSTPQTTLDAWSNLTGIAPTAVTIDVEGAELAVLEGAKRLLEEVRPLVWVSIHPDLMARDFGLHHGKEDVLALLHDLSYSTTILEVDHEEHHLAWPTERRDVVLP